jgi:hypothetical protein
MLDIDSIMWPIFTRMSAVPLYAGLVVEDVQSFMNDTNSISIEKKYKLAVERLLLHYLFKQPEKFK